MDGACPLCVAENHPAPRGRVVRATLLVAMAAAAVVMAVHWHLGWMRTEAESGQDNRTAVVPNGRVRFARSVTNTSAVSPKRLQWTISKAQKTITWANLSCSLAPSARPRRPRRALPWTLSLRRQKILGISIYPRKVPAAAARNDPRSRLTQAAIYRIPLNTLPPREPATRIARRSSLRSSARYSRNCH